MIIMKPEELALVYQQLVSAHQKRIASTKIKKKELSETIKRDDAINNEHIIWLRESAKALISKLRDIARTYNEENPEYVATIEDMMDILETAKLMIKKK